MRKTSVVGLRRAHGSLDACNQAHRTAVMGVLVVDWQISIMYKAALDHN
jgi:hypothetical protein